MSELSILVVLLEGLLSFFSPCVLPILPIYMSMLSNCSIGKLKEGKYDSTSLIINTVSFTMGISTTFFILGTSITVLSNLLKEYSGYISLIGGLIVVFMGLFHIGAFKSSLLNKDTRKISKVSDATVLSSYILGFTFSFGWSPCIGTVLTSILLMSSVTGSVAKSYVLLGVYTLGFIVPFILLAIFYNKLYKKLKWFKSNMSKLKTLGGLVIICTGMVMSYNGYKTLENDKQIIDTTGNTGVVDIYDMAFKDQNGEVHKLSDYKGKKVFLNFWATWCPPCREEMPYIEELYKERDDVVIIGTSTIDGMYTTEESVSSFLSENGYTFPTLYDSKGYLGNYFGITAYPTTIILDTNGDIINRVEGSLTKENMEYLIDMSN